MLYRIGRLLQVAGLLILPQGVVLELLDYVSLGKSLLIALGGGGLFLIGLGLQRTGRP